MQKPILDLLKVFRYLGLQRISFLRGKKDKAVAGKANYAILFEGLKCLLKGLEEYGLHSEKSGAKKVPQRSHFGKRLLFPKKSHCL